MKNRVWVVFVLGVWIASLKLPLEQEELKMLEFRLNQVYGLIGDALEVFALFEKRFPRNLDELCSSAYMPVACSDIHNPFEEIPLLATPEATPGFFQLVPDSTQHPLAGWIIFYNWVGQRHAFSFPHKWWKPEDMAGYLDPKSYEGWTDEMKTALSVARFLKKSIGDFFTSNGMRSPKSLQELTSQYPYLLKLRNAWSGKYAEPMVISCKGRLPNLREIPEGIEDGTPLLCDWTNWRPTKMPIAIGYAKGKLLQIKCNFDLRSKFPAPTNPDLNRDAPKICFYF